jgi:hypothetical protein
MARDQDDGSGLIKRVTKRENGRDSRNKMTRILRTPDRVNLPWAMRAIRPATCPEKGWFAGKTRRPLVNEGAEFQLNAFPVTLIRK